MLTSVTSYLLTRAEIYDAQRAMVWLTGSLNGRGWDHVRPSSRSLVLLVPVTLGAGPPPAHARARRRRRPGPRHARSSGVRSALLLAAVALAAIAVASAGPIGFVALGRPADRPPAGRRPQRRRCCRAPRVGALLLVASDLVARRIFAPTELPVGIVTAVLGRPLPAAPARRGQPDRKRRMTQTLRHDDAPTDSGAGDPARAGDDLSLAYDDRVDRRRPVAVAIPAGQVTVIVGRQRLRQVDAAARPGPAAQARATAPCCSTATTSTTCPPARWPPGWASCPSSRSRPRASASADLVARGRHPHQRWFRQWSTDRRGGGRRGPRGHRHRRPRRPRRSTSCRAGSASGSWIALALAQGTGADAARRADHVPRPGPPGRGARPAGRPQRARAAHHRARAARPQPGVPLRAPPGRHEGRRHRRRGPTGRGHHRRDGGARCSAWTARSSTTR